MSDIRPLTHQEVFDTLWNRYVVGDAKPSISDAGRCLYRGDDTRCFVGAFIPDHEYQSEMEGRGVSEILALKYTSDTKLVLSGCAQRFLGGLQVVHDQIAQASCFPDRPVEELALFTGGEIHRYKLNWKPSDGTQAGYRETLTLLAGLWSLRIPD